MNSLSLEGIGVGFAPLGGVTGLLLLSGSARSQCEPKPTQLGCPMRSAMRRSRSPVGSSGEGSGHSRLGHGLCPVAFSLVAAFWSARCKSCARLTRHPAGEMDLFGSRRSRVTSPNFRLADTRPDASGQRCSLANTKLTKLIVTWVCFRCGELVICCR